MKSKNRPQPIRFDEEIEDELRDLSAKTGLPLADLVRRCVNHALPKFVTGDENLLNYSKPAGKEAA